MLLSAYYMSVEIINKLNFKQHKFNTVQCKDKMIRIIRRWILINYLNFSNKRHSLKSGSCMNISGICTLLCMDFVFTYKIISVHYI